MRGGRVFRNISFRSRRYVGTKAPHTGRKVAQTIFVLDNGRLFIYSTSIMRHFHV
jgi:hypothetical protein